MPDDERVWRVPVTVLIIAPTAEDAFFAVAEALHVNPKVETVGGESGADEDVEATEELRAHEPLRWSCGEAVLPGETYREHVKLCDVVR